MLLNHRTISSLSFLSNFHPRISCYHEQKTCFHCFDSIRFKHFLSLAYLTAKSLRGEEGKWKLYWKFICRLNWVNLRFLWEKCMRRGEILSPEIVHRKFFALFLSFAANISREKLSLREGIAFGRKIFNRWNSLKAWVAVFTSARGVRKWRLRE